VDDEAHPSTQSHRRNQRKTPQTARSKIGQKNSENHKNGLIILRGQGIDVILGMSWMKMHKTVLDIADQLVHLNPPMYGKVILHLPAISRIKVSLHHVVELKLEDIHVIREF
jgi:hypothetical protein